MTNIELMQDLIDNINGQLKSQERDFIAIQTAIVVLKKQREYFVAKKKGLEEEQKKAEAPKLMSKKQKGRKGVKPPC